MPNSNSFRSTINNVFAANHTSTQPPQPRVVSVGPTLFNEAHCTMIAQRTGWVGSFLAAYLAQRKASFCLTTSGPRMVTYKPSLPSTVPNIGPMVAQCCSTCFVPPHLMGRLASDFRASLELVDCGLRIVLYCNASRTT